MGSRGDCFDNAVAESFFATLKKELVNRRPWPSESQERALAALRVQGRREFTRREYEEAAGIRRSAAGADLRELVRHGLLGTRGAGSNTRYLFAGVVTSGQKASRRGRPTKWTDTVIETELRAFLNGGTDWPSPAEFRASGKGPLYAAATRAGGIQRWRRMFGL